LRDLIVRYQLFILAAYTPSDQATCDSIYRNIATVIRLLDEGQAPDDVCVFLELCSGKKHAKTHKSVMVKNSLSAVPDQDCLSCKSVVAVVENQLQSNQTETEIEDAVRMLCACECSMSPNPLLFALSHLSLSIDPTICL
jgi:hypothetical protein